MPRYTPKWAREQAALDSDIGTARYCSKATRHEIEQVLAANGVSFWVKDALRSSLERDCVDAYHDAALLADLLRTVMEDILYGGEPKQTKRDRLGERHEKNHTPTDPSTSSR